MMIFRMSRYVRTCTHGKKLLVFVYVALVAGATAEQKLVGSCTVEAGNVRTYLYEYEVQRAEDAKRAQVKF